MKSFNDFKKKALENPEVRREYDALQDEFNLIDQLVTMRTSAGLTQEEVANKLGTNKSNISRLEHGKGNPSWSTLNKYAAACGFRVKLEAVEDNRASA
ncbi:MULTISPECIES: helix-turn-helix domain-containing protein [unclassified Marinobacter]|uniref:helix-turn-helix domain-containing protein n=1 Tax=unclassified Marinobacter TaxID=83889 RepID=UPI0019257F5B|nr:MULTISPECIES: helix-turn-helix transcriptional regulator [unclassified Marinobacter]MBL3824783.1 helix-turn-helix transcriptional regulator [Marinobacter sp. MC3]MBL3893289.1 helix-turn-helix transcriptional regulator [Marinobacter sp. MW3]|mmetsp:Transcript_11400/g.21392  ORF Transcript_11400/g.21392 Transcript_11400/m.21392 type:complete len:98 (+) Transcript_11400:59-352(+)